MGLLPFFKGDLSGPSSGVWTGCACVYTLTSATVGAGESPDEWSASYTGNLTIIQQGDAAFDSVTSLKVTQNAETLHVERRLGDGTVEAVSLSLLLGDGPGAGALSEDGKVKYQGVTRDGSEVVFQHQVIVSP